MEQGASYKLKGGKKNNKKHNNKRHLQKKNTPPLPLLNVSVDHPLPSASIEHFFWLGSCSAVTLCFADQSVHLPPCQLYSAVVTLLPFIASCLGQGSAGF